MPEFYLDRMELDDRILSVFGSEEGGTPFSPWICRELLGLGDDSRITPKRAARAVKVYMRQHWPKDKVEAAIAAADIHYDAAYVHKYAPWSGITL